MKRILINGFGRIGRCVFRNLWERGNNSQCVAVNDPAMSIDNMVYLLKFDTIYGSFDGNVYKDDDDTVCVFDDQKKWRFKVYGQRDFFEDGDKFDFDVVIESSGRDSCAVSSRKCLEYGAKYCIITNTFFDSDFTYVMGYNGKSWKVNKDKIISTSICDANATIPLLGKINDCIGIDYCFLTTLHPWLSYQNIMDAPVRMQKREGEMSDYFPLGRASVDTLIPKTTTVGPVIQRIIPELKNKISSFSYRTPTQIVASADMSVVLSKESSKGEIIELLNQIESQVVSLNTEDIISIDCRKSSFSSIVEKRWVTVEGNKLKLITWYDNEWGYCSRVIDLISRMDF